MTRAERVQKIKRMPLSPDRYFAAYCLEVLDKIEKVGLYPLATDYQGQQFKNGIKRFFKMDTKITDNLTLTL